MKTFGTLTAKLLVAALIFVTTAAATQAGRNPAIERAIENANRASDYLVRDTIRVLRYHRVRNVRDHQAYRAAKNLDNEIERLEHAWDDGDGARRLIAKLRDVNGELRDFERVAWHCRINRSVWRSLSWTRSSVEQLNGFAQNYLERRDRNRRYQHDRWEDRRRGYDEEYRRHPRRGYGHDYGYGYRTGHDHQRRGYYNYH